MQRHFLGRLGAVLLLAALGAVTAARAESSSEEITLVVGRSTVIKAPWPTVRVAVTDPNTAYVQALTPDQVLVQGFTVGATDLILWSQDEQRTWQRRIVVRPDVDSIRSTTRGLFPTAALDVNDSGDVLVVRGEVQSADQAKQLEKYLLAMALKTKTHYVNLTTLSGAEAVYPDIHNIRTTLGGMFSNAVLDVNECGGMLLVRGVLQDAQQAKYLEQYLKQLVEMREGSDGKRTPSAVPYVNMTTVAGGETRYLDINTIRKTVRGLFPTAVLDVDESGGVLFVRGVLRSADQVQQLKEYLEQLKEYKEETETSRGIVGTTFGTIFGTNLAANVGTNGGTNTGANVSPIEMKTVREVAKKIPYVNMTTLSGVQQVQLQVRVAEVSRAAVKALGINAFYSGSKDFFVGQRVGSSSGGAIVPSINAGPTTSPVSSTTVDPLTGATTTTAEQLGFQSTVFGIAGTGIEASPLVTIFAGFPRANLEFFFQALAENQYMRILANPTLVALSGEEATFLAGGEFPIPVVQGSGSGASTAITIQYKEFGVRLIFRPVVLGDARIRLRAMQEVSDLSDIGSLRIEGFSVPGLRTRRAEATMELQSGQSFAMAGLLQHNDSTINSRIPGLGDLPIIGSLFRSVRYANNETELIILVTASLIEPMSVATTPPLPGATFVPPNDWELYLEGRIEGKAPARLDPASVEWLRTMGLDQLAGPGAWDSYESPSDSGAVPSTVAAGAEQEPKEAPLQ